MGRSSSKAIYQQIMSWIPTVKKETKSNGKPKSESRLDYYAKKNAK